MSSLRGSLQIELPRPAPITGLSKLTVEGILRDLTATLPTEPIIPSGLKETLTSGIDTLDWALKRMVSETRDYQRLNLPPEVKTYNGLMVEILLKEQAIYTDIRSNYRSLLSYGHSDVETLDRVKEASLERDRLWSLIQYEWEELAKKV